MFQSHIYALLHTLLCINLVTRLFAKELILNHIESNRRVLQENLSNISVMIENELEHLHNESSKFNRFLVHDLPLRNRTLDLSYFVEVNKTIESFLRNISMMVVEPEAMKVGSNVSKVQSFDGTLNISRYPLVNMSLSKNFHNELDFSQSKREIESMIKEVLGSRERAEDMASEAMKVYHIFKNRSLELSIKAQERMRTFFHDNVKDNSVRQYSINQNRLHRLVHENLEKLQSPKLVDPKVWEEAGIRILGKNISSVDARKVISSITLETFRLRDDAKKDFLVAHGGERDEAKTRKHVGVKTLSGIGDIVDSSILDSDPGSTSLIVLFFNLAALPSIASDIEQLELRIEAWRSFFNGASSPFPALAKLHHAFNVSGSYESVTDLAFRTAALQSNAFIQKLNRTVSGIKHYCKVNLLKQNDQIIHDVMVEELMSNSRIRSLANELKMQRTLNKFDVQTTLTSIMTLVESTENLLAIGYQTSSEASKVIDEFEIETMEETLRIFAEAENERNQEFISLERIKLVGEETRKSLLEVIDTLFKHLFKATKFFISEPDGCRQLIMSIILVTALVFMISLTKEVVEVLFDLVIKSFFMPRLVREWGYGVINDETTSLKNIVLRNEDRQRLKEMCKVIKLGRRRRAPLRNLLLVGPPGSGKSMIAKSLAKASGLPYGVMSGADVAPLRHQGPTELRKLLRWAKNRKDGSILIIDDAESAFGKRLRTQANPSPIPTGKNDNNLLSAARDVLNVFLSLTGDTDGKFMLILTSSNPSALDDAVLDRCDDIIDCHLPSEEERKKIISLELQKRFKFNFKSNERRYRSLWKSLLCINKNDLNYSKDFDVEKAATDLCKDTMTIGFSGRELTGVIRAVESAVYETDDLILSVELWDKVVSMHCESTKAKQRLYQGTEPRQANRT